ncbi:OprD family porin [Pseudomonas oryzihabitans]|uniref:OprD family porin n=1 Tax=Pseudomonas oryzihabitans TaxID=47885 RepID=UPI00214F3350|nr:OprD family porin [Pseudomonas psychrotolerans]UUW72018.1 OprD family porin [Pseudomonas psychrotolerans]
MKLSLFSPLARRRTWLLGVPGLLLTGAALASQQSDAKGFVEDGDLTLLLRNYYYLRQNEGDGHGAEARNSRDPRSWTQAFLLNYTSGFTQGTVGVGVDAYGYLGLKLDGGDGHANTPNMPVDGDGSQRSEFSKGGAAVKLRVSNTVLKYGDQQPTAPVLAAGGNWLFPQTARGWSLVSQEVDHLMLEGGHFTAATAPRTTGADGGIFAGYAGVEAASASYAGGVYKFSDHLSASLYAGHFEDVWDQYYGNLNYVLPLATEQSLTFDANLYRTLDAGSAKAGSIANTAGSLAAAFQTGAHTFTLIHQRIHGDQPFDYAVFGAPVPGAFGDSILLGNSMQFSDFNGPGERSWQARYDLDMESYGVPGLSLMVRHTRGSGIDGSKVAADSAYAGLYGDGDKEHETDLEAKYVLQNGPAKDLSFRLRQAWHSGSQSTGGTVAETRLITEYPLNIL